MRALDRLPPRRASRSIHPALALLASLVVAVVAATAISPVANADPDPTHQGPWLEVDPSHGRVTDGFTATYWYVDTGGCPYATATFTWDTTEVGSAALDPVTCSVAFPFDAPTTPEIGLHNIFVVACFVDSTGTEQCEGISAISVPYFVDPTPTLDLDPVSGYATSAFSATYSTHDVGCPYDSVQFAWDTVDIGLPVPMSDTCTLTHEFTSAPLPDAPGTHVLGAMACDGSVCEPGTLTTASYEVLPPPVPTLTLDPTSGTAATPFSATYSADRAECEFYQVQFFWDTVAVGGVVPVDQVTCTATVAFPAAPVPDDPGTHVVGVELCIDNCDAATLLEAPYEVLPLTAPPTPTLDLDPVSGYATSAFSATYSTHDVGCPYDSVQFEWDGVALGGPVPMSDTCSLTHEIAPTPLPDDPGTHVVGAMACDGSVCEPGTRATASYEILPPPPQPVPTLTLIPTTGRAGDPFRATYATDTSGCPYTNAIFTWDGTGVGGPIPLGGSCTALLSLLGAPAPNGPGSHVLTAIACEGTACDPATLARATYIVAAPRAVTPTPTPTPAPTATPTPRPTPPPTPAPTASPEPSVEPTPSADASIEPGPLEPTPDPNPSPTGEVEVETNRPEPSPTQVAVVVVPSPSPSGNPFVPALATFVGGPGPIDPAVVGTNLLLTLLIVFLFGLTAEVFNSTMDANRSIVHGWWARLLGGPLAFVGGITFTGTGLSHLSGTSRFGSIARVLVILGLSGLIYGFLSPDFGMNAQSLVLFISLVIGLGFITFYSEGSASRLARRRFSADASIRLYGTAVIVAILAVIISRSMTFQPGLVYGFIASAVIIAPIALAKRDDATLVLIPAFGLLVVSILAWLLLGPVRVLAEGGAPLPALGETILAMIVIGGLEGLFITMIPLRFLDGSTVKSWSFVAWALVFATVTFLWWQLLFNQNAAYVAALQQTNVQVVLFTLGAFMLTTGGIWSYFRFRPSPAEEPEAVAAGEVTTETSAETATEV